MDDKSYKSLLDFWKKKFYFTESTKTISENNPTTTTKSTINDTTEPSSSMEVFRDTLKKISALGDRGKKVLNRLIQEIDHRDLQTERLIQQAVDKVSDREKIERLKRDILLSSPIDTLAIDDEDNDAAIEEVRKHTCQEFCK